MLPSEQSALLMRIFVQAERLAELIGVPKELRLLPNKPLANGHWLEIAWAQAGDGDDDDGYRVSLMCREEGETHELAEVNLDHTDHLLFKLFEYATHYMAASKLGPAMEGIDRRPELFSAQEALLQQLNPVWAKRTSYRHADIMRRSPAKP